jgi:ATP-dependent Zn protease
MQATIKTIIFWTLMVVLTLVIWAFVRSNTSEQMPTLTFSQFTHEIDQDNVREVTVSGSDDSGIFLVRGALKKGIVHFQTATPSHYMEWLRALNDKEVSITF